ncbi:peptidase M50 [Alicyclobacillus hesperidum URH17-3-68]|uniref:Zinc metalloprotease n=1 Tax=Alicyclobacillus hesperidum TaxID=89784 RepID=A0A1H2T193_9BACL|nr:site-2 protease family protein [Alicyclobacillus hesperidum]EJY56406.1 peptidase M50 [Alicyclobacillus hesperidum URH17-3-68]GLV13709.1 zinc metalloprotease [Alicyclobacillus hesperidum]SDW37580.1 Zn-dependent protease (includes SpoIVFB) [Alicyclobacillus hesperidum]
MFAQWSSPTWILRVLLVLASLVLHEFAHALAADLQGDKTARHEGRLTLNPLVHLEWTGVIAMLIAPIGWARPVPIQPAHFRHRRLGVIVTAAAGPCSNLVIAAASYGVLRAMQPYTYGILGTVLGMLFEINIALFVLNMIPIPPLDGSRILYELLPYRQAAVYSRIEPYGPWILLFVFLVPPLNAAFSDLVYLLMSWFYGT